MVLILVPIRCLFGSYLDWNLVGTKCRDERRRTTAEGGLYARTRLTIRASDHAILGTDDVQYFTLVRCKVEAASDQLKEEHRE